MLVVNNEPSLATPPSLTHREKMIVFLMGAGRNTPEIATLLELSPRTVENHKRHLYDKLGVGSRSQAVAKAIRLGLLHPGQSRAPGQLVPGLLRRAAEPGCTTLAVLMGEVGQVRDKVARILVSERVPFVTARNRHGITHDHWLLWHRGPVITVLVDPEPEDWSVTISLRTPTVVIFSGEVSEQLAMADAMARNAGGLVVRPDTAAGLCPALAAVAQGLLVMSWRSTEALLAWAPAAPPLPVTQLTTRESEILDSIACGHTIRQTARALGIASKTVENIQARLFRKLGAHNRMDALTIADSWGLIKQSALPAT